MNRPTSPGHLPKINELTSSSPAAATSRASRKLAKIETLIDDHDIDGALKQIAAGAELSDPDWQAQRAAVAFRAGRLGLFRRILERTTARRSPNGIVLAAQYHLAIGETARAKQLLDEALAQAPNLPAALQLMAMMMLIQGCMPEAARALRKFVSLPNEEKRGLPAEDIFPGLLRLADGFGLATPYAIRARCRRLTLPLVPGQHLMFINVMINGQGPFRLALDTGGSFLVSLDQSLSKTLNIKPLGELVAYGISGRAAGKAQILNNLTWGGMSVDNVPCISYPFDELAGKLGEELHGIFGTGWLRRFQLKIDLHKNEALIEQPDSLPPRSRSWHAEVFRSGGQRRVSVPFLFLGDGKICFQATAGERRFWALLDTGAAKPIFSTRLVRKLIPHEQLTSLSVPIGGMGESAPELEALTGPAIDVNLGSMTYNIPQSIGLSLLEHHLNPLLGMEIDLIAGAPLLRMTGGITIHFPSQRLIFPFPK